jgi:predicted SnoaL-like aldol condensation-catalyzing enzyme
MGLLQQPAYGRNEQENAFPAQASSIGHADGWPSRKSSRHGHWFRLAYPCIQLSGDDPLNTRAFPSRLRGLLAAALLVLPAAHAVAGDNRDIMRAFVDTAYAGRQPRTAYERHAAPDLIQHNAGIADGREAAIAELEGLLKDPQARFEVKRVLVDGDLAVVHFHGTLSAKGPSAAVMEMFRLKGGRIVEHWSVFQPIDPAAPTVNPHPHF